MDLQKMLDVCCADFSAIGMKFNPIKSKSMCVGPNVHIKPICMKLDSVQLEWATTIKYLGIQFLAGRNLTIDISDCRKKLYFSVTKILNKSKYCNEIVRLNMVETYCLPILTYAIDALSVHIMNKFENDPKIINLCNGQMVSCYPGPKIK